MFELFCQQLLNGLTIGMIYALIALGYTMVYGVIELINFAHGEVFMVGAYLALTAIAVLSPVMPGPALALMLALVFIFAMAGSAVLGATVERVAYRPLRRMPKLTALITSIGVSFFLQNAVMLIYGSKEQNFPEIIPPVRFPLGPVEVTLIQLIIFVTAVCLMIGLTFFINRTRHGKALRALAENPDAARLMGISVDRMIQLTFMLGSSLAAVAGALFGLSYGSVNFHEGYLLGLKAFTAAVLGGIGSIPGAVLGGVVLGVCETLVSAFLASSYRDAIAFAVLIVVLLVRPAGLLGRATIEKV